MWCSRCCISNVTFVKQKLVQTCAELDEKKADKEFVLNAIKAVSVYIL